MIFRRKVKTEKLQSFLTLVTITQLPFFSKFRRVCVCTNGLSHFLCNGEGGFRFLHVLQKRRATALFRISYTKTLIFWYLVKEINKNPTP